MVVTRLDGSVRVEPKNAAAALEVMSRFAVDPRWLIYLPPTLSAPEVSPLPGLLEHPAGAFGYFSLAGVTKVIVEEKRMGSRAVVVLARDAEAARRRFGVADVRAGVVFTRTGRAFFHDDASERDIIARLIAAASACRPTGFARMPS